jgi:hypothetical protein
MNAPIHIPLVNDEGEDLEWLPEWGCDPSPFYWQVMVFGGFDRNGFIQPPQVFQFPKRKWSHGYTLEGVIARAESMAERQHRTRFAVRDTDGSVVHLGRSGLLGLVEERV